MKERGFLFVAGPLPLAGKKRQFLLFPSSDKYAALNAVGTNGANYSLDTGTLVNELRQIEKEYPFELVCCGYDCLEAEFLPSLGERTHVLASRLLKLCPDLGAGSRVTEERLSEQIAKSHRVFLWWD
jgi:hypothetical protein